MKDEDFPTLAEGDEDDESGPKIFYSVQLNGSHPAAKIIFLRRRNRLRCLSVTSLKAF
jgi:hypothetical protein